MAPLAVFSLLVLKKHASSYLGHPWNLPYMSLQGLPFHMFCDVSWLLLLTRDASKEKVFLSMCLPLTSWCKTGCHCSSHHSHVRKEIQMPAVRKRWHQPYLSFSAFVSRKPTISQSSPFPPTTFNKLPSPSHGPESGHKPPRDAKESGKIDNGNFSNIRTHHLGGGSGSPQWQCGFWQ